MLRPYLAAALTSIKEYLTDVPCMFSFQISLRKNSKVQHQILLKEIVWYHHDIEHVHVNCMDLDWYLSNLLIVFQSFSRAGFLDHHPLILTTTRWLQFHCGSIHDNTENMPDSMFFVCKIFGVFHTKLKYI